jgi:7-carboxy-7-deazaguanine synthase
MTLEEILQVVERYGCKLVEVTGGDPLVQHGVHELMKLLCDRGYEVLLETGGSIDIGTVDPRVKRIVDFKCPGSGMAKKNLWTNVDHLRPSDEVKFVIGDREDFDWAVDMIKNHGIESICPILMSPVFGVVAPMELAGWILEGRINVRLQLQMHKFIWEPETRGV